MEFDRRYTQLNASQKKAVDTIDGPVLVIAGPGTGKTELLSTRVANILKKTDTPPEGILCLTFTESGATAMRERLVGIIGKDAYKVAIHTFHSFGSDIISRYREYFYNGALFSPADDLARYEIIKSIFDGLEYNNPLASKMNGEYTHMSDAQTVISELKRAGGLTSDELLAVLQQDEASLENAEHILAPIAEKRVSAAIIDEYTAALETIRPMAEKIPVLYEVTPLLRVLVSSLEQAIDHANERIASGEKGTPPISAWKATWFTKDEHKNTVFKDKARINKLKLLSFVYYEYLRKMEEANKYDYDDMILQVVHAMEVHSDLRFSLQEQYLYVMVDEFQDTNLAQMRILHNLTDNPVNEGSPNILAVGDDDQAVYGFQGADVSNILQFQDRYPTAQLITLTDNYRSGAPVLEASRSVITQGTDRLENRLPDIDKQLTPHRTEPASVELQQHGSIHEERYAVAQAIRQRILDDPRADIAILARKHADLEAILPYLEQAEVPVRYEKQDNALDQAPIVALEQVSRVLIALSEGRHDLVNALLPELLAHPAWNLRPVDLWYASLRAYENRKHWMSIMAETPELHDIHEWLVERAAEVPYTPLEHMLDRIMGKDDVGSPFFMHFFSPDTLQHNPEQYLEYLEALRVIRDRIQEHNGATHPTLPGFVEFIETCRALRITINVSRTHDSGTAHPVQLLSAHKSKGLEFDVVYVINATDKQWGSGARSRTRNISYPENLPLDPAGDTADERLRLFYVAMTRARNDLVLSYSSLNDNESKTLLADFLVETGLEPVVQPKQNISEQLQTALVAWHEPLSTPTKELKDILKPKLDTYRLSATALTSFLDVSRGGPRAFLLSSLLRFPEASSPAIAYGNAVHRALQQAHVHLVATGEQRPVEDVLHDFEVALSHERLTPEQQAEALQKGSDHLPVFLKSDEVQFTKTQKSELPFAHQEVQYGEARLTGKIDVADIDEENRVITVTDYKTGRPPLGWKSSKPFEKEKLHHYRQQLLFYKLLLGGSRDYAHYDVTEGRIAFVQPTSAGKTVVLDMPFEQEELERVMQLIKVVWEHITTLNLPDTSGYSPDLKGIQAFEQDLIDGKL